jgi:hypothetical protein
VSSACRPRPSIASNVIGSVTPGTGASGGYIADSTTRYFAVAPVTKDGEQLASTEVSQTTGSGGGGAINTLTLSWAANPAAYRYKVYVGTSSGALYLRHVIPGFTYNASGTVTGNTTTTVTGVKSYTSDANGNVNAVTFLLDPNTAGAEVPTALQSDVPLVLSGGIEPETVWLIDVDEFQGMGRLPYTNQGGSQFNGLISMEMLAKTDSELPFLLQSYCAVAPSFEATSSVIRGLRIS